MTILVTGATGMIGSGVLDHLTGKGVDVHALTRDPSKAEFPKGIVPVAGDMLDVDSMRSALAGASTLFLINAVAPAELSQALLTLNRAREAGLKRIVYFSVFNGEAFTNVPHFAAKFAVEKMIREFGIPATVLRANCFMQNDAIYFKDALLGPGLYPFPIGDKGVSMIDARDVSEVAAIALLLRERSSDPLPHHVVNMSGPDPLTGESIAAIWSNLLGKQVRYPGTDCAAFEKQVARHAPNWLAMDLRLMLERFVADGMSATSGDIEEMTKILGRPLRSYVGFATETLAKWRN
jgi:uncharacterized protein YbjT (DUF2867 family)